MFEGRVKNNVRKSFKNPLKKVFKKNYLVEGYLTGVYAGTPAENTRMKKNDSITK